MQIDDGISKEKAIALLKEVRERYNNDIEYAHSLADQILVALINDKQIKLEYDLIDKWYA